MTDISTDLRHAVERLTGRIRSVAAMDGGITNRNHKLETATGSFVLRLAGHRTELLGINRAHEYRCAQIAHAAGVGAEPIAHLPEHNAILTRFVRNAETLTPERATGALERIVAGLKATHAAPAFPGSFSPFGAVRQYHALSLEHGVRLPAHLPDALAAMQRIEGALGPHARTCPCHNDLLPGNVLDDGTRLWIIDWEYAGNGNPFFDLGNFAVNLGLDETGCARLLRAYFGETGAALEAQLHLMRLASDLREAFWGFLQSGLSTLEFDFMAYGTRHLERFRTNAARPEFAAWLAALEPE